MITLFIVLAAFEIAQVVPQEWYQQFISENNIPKGVLFDVLNAASYMKIQPLVNLACYKVALMIKGKNAEEVCMTCMFVCNL